MAEKSLAVIIRESLGDFAKIEEGLRFAVAAASKDMSVDLIFAQDGVELLRPSVEMDEMVAFDVEHMLEMLHMLKAAAFAERESLPENERNAEELRYKAQILPRLILSKRLLKKDFVASF